MESTVSQTDFEQIKSVYQMLEDKESKDIYLKRLNYLLTDEWSYLREIVHAYLPDVGPGKVRNFDDVLAKMPCDRRFVLFGAGKFGQSLLPMVEHDGRFMGFCSSTKRRQVYGCAGYPVMSPEELIARRDLAVIVSACGAKFEIMQILKDGGYPQNLIFDGRVLGEKAVYDPEQYFSPDFMKYEEQEIFVDVGCLNLGSSLKLKEYCKQLSKVYAFEPDPVNYECCMERKHLLGRTETIVLPYGAWSEKTTLSFNSGLLGSSGLSDSGEGNTIISVVPIDEMIDAADKVTFLKMDIEGSEQEALKGARQVISRNKPKLAICIYHKPDDMWTIPMYIKKLVPEYKLYIRHHSTGPDETVLYAVM